MEFRVTWEIEIEAASPKEAALDARAIQLTPGMSATVFDVWAHLTGKMYRIDLVEKVDRLDSDELFAVRAGLRLLQCKPDTPPSIQDVATIMLIFLDRDNAILKRVIADRLGSESLEESIRTRQDSHFKQPVWFCSRGCCNATPVQLLLRLVATVFTQK